MGNLQSVLAGSRNGSGLSLDESPHGLPDNSYWRRRRTEDTWKLREALLDGDTAVACRLLGIDRHAEVSKSQPSLQLSSRVAQVGSKVLAGNEKERAGDDSDEVDMQRSSGCDSLCKCIVLKAYVRRKRAPRPESKATPKPEADSYPTGINVMASSGILRSGCHRLDLGKFTWDDDGGHSALHYLGCCFPSLENT